MLDEVCCGDVYKRQVITHKTVICMLMKLYSHCEGPVSYTHLDVYKRQVLPSKHEEKSFFEKCVCGCVSICVSVCLCVEFFLWESITAAKSNRIKRLFEMCIRDRFRAVCETLFDSV